jgi:hypothetical protein
MKNEENYVKWSPSIMLEVTLNEPDDFLKVKETLTRIGIESKRDTNVLYQSCHILHKQGHYFVTHFKEMFSLDGRDSTITESDIGRRNSIAGLLSDWGLLDIIDPELITHKEPLKNIKIISHKEKREWRLESKYNIGNVKQYK